MKEKVIGKLKKHWSNLTLRQLEKCIKLIAILAVFCIVLGFIKFKLFFAILGIFLVWLIILAFACIVKENMEMHKEEKQTNRDYLRTILDNSELKEVLLKQSDEILPIMLKDVSSKTSIKYYAKLNDISSDIIVILVVNESSFEYQNISYDYFLKYFENVN